jgi:hypothetical protein
MPKVRAVFDPPTRACEYAACAKVYGPRSNQSPSSWATSRFCSLEHCNLHRVAESEARRAAQTKTCARADCGRTIMRRAGISKREWDNVRYCDNVCKRVAFTGVPSWARPDIGRDDAPSGGQRGGTLQAALDRSARRQSGDPAAPSATYRPRPVWRPAAPGFDPAGPPDWITRCATRTERVS